MIFVPLAGSAGMHTIWGDRNLDDVRGLVWRPSSDELLGLQTVVQHTVATENCGTEHTVRRKPEDSPESSERIDIR